MTEDSWTRHTAACARGEASYVDPVSGLVVLTEVGLRARGACCGCGCRHCPFEHLNVPEARRADRIQRPAVLHGTVPDDRPCDVLFWSGGKDSLLAQRALARDPHASALVLFTTFDAETREIAHQEVPLHAIIRQADALGAPLVGVPLHTGRDYVEQLSEGLSLVPNVDRLVFGDLHLEEIRHWRQEQLEPVAAARDATLHFPLWHAAYPALLDELERSGIPCEVTAVPDPGTTGVSVGQLFDRALVERLPKGVDPFGERGDFHTLARIWEAPATLSPA